MAQGIKPLAIKTQIPGLIQGLTNRTLSLTDGSLISPAFIQLELEKGIGEDHSVLAYLSLRNRYDAGLVVPGEGPHFSDWSGMKVGIGYRHYMSSKEGLEGFYLSPILQYWKGEFFRFNGDYSDGVTHRGVSAVLHAGYQWILWKGLCLDASAGLGIGYNKGSGTSTDWYSGMLFIFDNQEAQAPSSGGAGSGETGFGIAGGLRIGIGWCFN